ncbi:MAG TPA: asparagine synthase-related protein [Thermoanaerobaculia bacterium]|nr:asparagine synthase-related protein [Thermoanaerobaculia bacterium]
MSGFCVIVDFSGAPVDAAALRGMAAAASRRGPDGETHRIAGPAGLCHLPLHSTAEAARERQPLRSSDGSIHLVADIRLDNRQELIDRLRADGALTQDDPGDAELLLAAYNRWDDDCPRHLLGDFAFVLWDGKRQRILGACDPLGVKPLHYTRTGSLLCLASEAQQILRHPAVPCQIDEIAVGDYLLDLSPDPDRTLFHHVRRLPPAHRLVACRSGEKIERYWALDPDARTVYRRDEDYAAHFLELFQRAVGDRLRTQAGSVGILMSGGLDSTSVAAAASRCLPKDGSLRLFAASFLFERLRECDEEPFIRAVATRLGIEVETVCADRFPVLGERPALEAPSLAWDGCFREALRKIRNRGARVLLTGFAGDDLITGSPLVYADRLRRGDLRALFEIVGHAVSQRRQRRGWRGILYHHLAQPLLPPAANDAILRLSGRFRRPELPDWIDADFARRTDLAARINPPAARRSGDAARREIYEYFHQSPWNNWAPWYEQHAAANGIEVRHPFLDRRLVELLVSIPPSRLYRVDLSKPLLRESMAGLLPDAVRLRADKTRLGAFIDLPLGQDQRSRIERCLEAPLVEQMGFVDGERLRSAYRRQGGSINGLWYAFALEVWLREHEISLGSARSAVTPAA